MRNQPGDVFWKRLHHKAERKGFPLRAMFELTYRCNFRCPHCYIPGRHRRVTQELDTRKVCAVLDALCDNGCLYLGLTGGEPFVRKDIFDILRYARKIGLQLIIYTNGSCIDKACADRLADLGPNKIDITIPAMGRHAFESVTGSRGSHAKVFKAIRLLKERGLALGFKACVLKQNEDQIPAIKSFADSLEADLRLDIMLQRRLDGSTAPYRYRGSVGMHSAAAGKTAQAGDCKQRAVGHPGRTALFTCKVGKSQLAINPAGKLKFCLMIDYPMIPLFAQRSQPGPAPAAVLRSAWLKMKQLAGAVRPDGNYRCPSCEFRQECKWCPALGWLTDKRFTTCDPFIRSWLQDRKEAR